MSFESEIVDTWLVESKEVFDRERESRLKFEKNLQEQLLSYESKKLECEKEMSLLTHLSSEQEMFLKKLNDEIEDLSLTTDAQKDKASNEKENIENIGKSNTKTMKALTSKEAVINTKLEKIQKGIKFYEENLQLKLEHTPNSHLKFTFTSIDENNEEKAFYFKIKVEGTPGTYIIMECNPEVENIENLVEDLNGSNDLLIFLCRMRNAFKGTVKTSSP